MSPEETAAAWVTRATPKLVKCDEKTEAVGFTFFCRFFFWIIMPQNQESHCFGIIILLFWVETATYLKTSRAVWA